MRSFSFSQRAWTLVELLVSITIVIVLTGLITVVSLNARESARKTSCANNLRQIGLALGMYRSEHNDYIPPYHSGHRASTDESQDSDPIQNLGISKWFRTMQPYGVTEDILFCPSDPYAREDHYSEGAHHEVSSYRHEVMVDVMVQKNVRVVEALGLEESNTGYMTDPILDWVEVNGVKNPIGPHRGGTTVLMFDGHVEFFKPISEK
jgi:prepilin-type processing-associated H-X9-DG protein